MIWILKKKRPPKTSGAFDLRHFGAIEHFIGYPLVQPLRAANAAGPDASTNTKGTRMSKLPRQHRSRRPAMKHPPQENCSFCHLRK
jgi:hypothetical protein